MVSQNAASKISSKLDLKIFVKDVRDRQGRKRPLLVKTWSTVKDVKDQIQQLLHVPPSAQRLYFSPLLVSAKELPNHRTLQDAGVYRSGETLLLEIKAGSLDDTVSNSSSLTSLRSFVSDICVSSSMLESTPKGLRRLIQQARRGMTVGIKPELVLDGSGGTYFLHDARKAKVAVFKPADEEPYAENNPRGYVKQGFGSTNVGLDMNTEDDMSLRSGIKPGEACLREVAAYLLDHDGFSGVPMTTLAEARHPGFNNNGKCLKVAEGGAALGTHSLANNSPNDMIKKVGSCQEYAHAECTMDDLSPSKISVDEVHKIAILDIRLMNADRNVGNLLCRRRPDDTFELVPIDHGYCLRSVCDVCWFDWCWLDWPQLKKPMSKESRDYVLNLDIESDVCVLKEQLAIGSEAIDFFRTSTRLLKAGVQAGLTLFDIAILCCRHDDAGVVRSKLEFISSQSHELATSAIENGKWHHAAASRALADQIGSSPMKSSMTRSKSSVHFSLIGFEDSTPKTMLPNMAMTSGSSDSSSDAGNDELENEDCEEWAAAIIEDVDIEKSSERLTERHRCLSFSSNASDSSSILSSSPVGFWHVKPGATKKAHNDVLWSPTNSSPNLLTKAVTNAAPYLPLTIPCEPEVAYSDVLPSVRFSPLLNRKMGLKSKPSMGMVRSQSFSTISMRSLQSQNPHGSLCPNRQDRSSTEQYRIYFLKFVGLLIERVTVVPTCNRPSFE